MKNEKEKTKREQRKKKKREQMKNEKGKREKEKRRDYKGTLVPLVGRQSINIHKVGRLSIKLVSRRKDQRFQLILGHQIVDSSRNHFV